MTLSKRMAAGVLRGLTGRLWGSPPLLIDEIVERLGAVGALRWFAANLPAYEATMKRWGPIRTHLLCVEASLLNGCAYCIHAHAYPFQLYWFRDRGGLFPMDEHAMVALRDRTDAELRAKLINVFHENDLSDAARDFDDLWALKFEQKRATDDTLHRIQHILGIFEMLNYCGIDAQTPFDHAHDPINKDESLKRRYAEARLDQR